MVQRRQLEGPNVLQKLEHYVVQRKPQNRRVGCALDRPDQQPDRAQLVPQRVVYRTLQRYVLPRRHDLQAITVIEIATDNYAHTIGELDELVRGRNRGNHNAGSEGRLVNDTDAHISGDTISLGLLRRR